MFCANQHNLVRCDGCDALYDRTAKLVRGYTRGGAGEFTATGKVKDNCCPVCGKERE